MRNLIIFFCFYSSIYFISAQNIRNIDTIYANDQKLVSLFFQDPIRQGITGSSNYAFSYNRDKEQSFGLLQATPSEESNLLVITSNGKIYSYLLRYSEKLNKLSYFIAATESIGNQNSGSIKLSKQQVSFTDTDTVTSRDYILNYPKLCKQLLKSQRPFDQVKYRKGIRMKMTKTIYYKTDLYIKFEISNNSEIDYEINSLDLLKVNGNKRRKASYQELLLSPVYRYKMPLLVPKGQKVQFVFVYPKFTLGKHEKLKV
ncbi:MAG: DUF4138 domain-containing protein, partial [Arenibacter latericius]|nr:DUF4138 domain-containing protein [Arenibacter latericius]